jgi:hypothetical protein
LKTMRSILSCIMLRKLKIWFLSLLTALSVATPGFVSVQVSAQNTQVVPIANWRTLPDAPSASLAAEQQQSTAQEGSSGSNQEQPDPNLTPSSRPRQNSPQTPVQKKQPKRILWVIPNYRAVSADEDVPPLDAGGKFRLMVDDSFDYSAFLYTGFVAGLRYGFDSYPEFGRGFSGYGRYYWRFFVDQAVGNSFTEFLLPVAFKQDPRYFTKGHGSFLNRTGYALSRIVITRSDKGTEQFNISELGGNLAAAGISNAYYPANERGISNTMNNYAVQVGLDAGFNVVKEFWPDIQHNILHMKE